MEDFIQLLGKIVVVGVIKGDFIRGEHPVEVAPHFAAEELFGMNVFREGAKSGDDGGGDGDVGVVFVGEVVGVDGVRLCGFDDLAEFGNEGGIGGVFDGGTGVVELPLGGVFADFSSLGLFFGSGGFHLVVGEVCEGAGAGAAAAVAAGDAAEPMVGGLVALGDAVEGHELEVIGVGADAEVGDAG